MNRPNLTTVISFLTTFLLSPALWASTSAAQVEASANRYLSNYYQQQYPDAQIRVHITPVNTALALPDCADTLKVEAPRGSGSRITTRVSCSHPRNWGLFLTAQVEVFRNVVVTRRPVARGQTLGNDDIMMQRLDISDESRGYFSRPEDVLGLSAGRQLPNGSVLNASVLDQPTLVHRGDAVIIEVAKGTLRLRAQGTALEDGQKGDQIRVKNNRSGQEIKALVAARGLVQPVGR